MHYQYLSSHQTKSVVLPVLGEHNAPNVDNVDTFYVPFVSYNLVSFSHRVEYFKTSSCNKYFETTSLHSIEKCELYNWLSETDILSDYALLFNIRKHHSCVNL